MVKLTKLVTNSFEINNIFQIKESRQPEIDSKPWKENTARIASIGSWSYL